MNKDEYWLLDSVVESRCPLVWLVAKNVGELLNKRDHGLKRDELMSVLNLLFRRGDLYARLTGKSLAKEVFIPTESEIEAALSHRLNCCYGLTLQGGARWDEVSQPHWERYISDSVYAEPQEGEIISSDRDLVEQYDSLTRHDSDTSIVPGSKRWDVLRPWQAAYWKELPVGHRLRFKYEWVERSPEPTDPEISEWFKKIRNWYTPFFSVVFGLVAGGT
jgi:hypothetical protein